MTRERRDRKRAREREAGRHTGADHSTLQFIAAGKARDEGKRTPGPVNCPVCRPGPKVWDRGLAGKAAAA